MKCTYARSLLETAGALAKRKGRPRLAGLNRAVSTAYYAVFSALSERIVVSLCGSRPKQDEPSLIWAKVFRSIDHESLARELAKGAMAAPPAFGAELAAVSPAFFKLKADRHAADYSPTVSQTKQGALDLIEEAREAVVRIENALPADVNILAVNLLVQIKHR